MVFPDGAAHAVYKRIEGERTRHEHERNEGEMLRESLSLLRLAADTFALVAAYPGPSS